MASPPRHMGYENLAPTVVTVWRRGGPDSLVTIRPFNRALEPEAPIGICTAIRFTLGLDPLGLSRLLGLYAEWEIRSGVEVYRVQPLPGPEDFTLAGYAPRRPVPPPEDGAPAPPPQPMHPIYPPLFGAPRWDVTGTPQSHLVRLAYVRPGTTFAYETRLLAGTT